MIFAKYKQLNTSSRRVEKGSPFPPPREQMKIHRLQHLLRKLNRLQCLPRNLNLLRNLGSE